MCIWAMNEASGCERNLKSSAQALLCVFEKGRFELKDGI